MNSLLRDLRYAFRGLLRTPVFTIGVIVTLALGIGVNATMFGVVDTLFLRPPPGVQDAGRVVRVYYRHQRTNDNYTGATNSYPAFRDLRDAGIFERTAAISGGAMSMGRGASAEHVDAALVSHDYFPLLGTSPALGRFFGADDDKPGAPGTAVLSHGFWRRRFAGDSSVIGRVLPLGHGSYTVIGVAPRDFAGIDLSAPDLWLPIEAAAGDAIPREVLSSRNWFWNQAIARLKPGMRAEDAASLATAAYLHGMDSPSKNDSNTTVVLGPVQEARGPEGSSEWKVSAWVGGVALIVLLIACANVANLLLARGVNRRRELAVRAGLGAGRGGLMRMLLTESLLLALLGGGAAMLVTAWGGTLARGLLIPELASDAAVVDLRVLAFAAAAVVATTVLIGLVPALQASRTDLADALKSGGKGSTSRGGRTRAALLVLQVAMTLSLLVGAGLFVRSLRNVQHLDLGFDADRVLEATVDLRAVNLEGNAARDEYLRLLERVQHLSGVSSAAASMAPFGWGFSRSVRFQGVDSLPRTAEGGPYMNVVSADYFATMGSRLVQGRFITSADHAGAAHVGVITRTLAKLVWPGQDAIGKCMYLGDSTVTTCTQVVGIMEDAKRGEVTEGPQMIYYLPLAQADSVNVPSEIHTLVVRSRTRAADVAEAVRREIQSAGDLPYANVRSLADRIAPQYQSWKLGASAFTAFGALALLIAATGIFAVLSYSVSQRTQEIGVRVALGAQAGHVVRMVVGQGLRAAVVGLVLGGAAGYALARAVRSLLYDVKPGDPFIFAAGTAVLFAVALLASWLPARRAARVDPMVALRTE